jgi:D-amino-acid dehydrogenase
VAALTAINRRAFPAWEALLGRAGLAALLRPLGAIEIYDTPASLAAGFERLRAVPPELTGGVSLLGGDELDAAEPALGPGHAGGVLIPATRVLTDPLEVVRGLAGYARGLGVAFRCDRVDRVRPGEVVLADGGTVAFDRLVVAAGVWAGRLLRGLGETQPLEAERGYNLTVPLPRPVVNRALLFADRGVVATPLTGALRFGGWDELGGVERPPDPRIVRRLEVLAAKLLPGFDWPGAVRWMGHRPSLPDSLPVIAASRRHPGIVYAFGHGHLGMTQGPATAEAVAALVAGEDPPFDLSPFCSRA